MYARVSRYEVPMEKLDDDVRGVDATQKRVTDMPGSLGLFYLMDRETGKTMSITLWESEQAMRDSEAAANTLRTETSEAAMSKVMGIERYEVVAQPAAMLAGTAH